MHNPCLKVNQTVSFFPFGPCRRAEPNNDLLYVGTSVVEMFMRKKKVHKSHK